MEKRYSLCVTEIFRSFNRIASLWLMQSVKSVVIVLMLLFAGSLAAMAQEAVTVTFTSSGTFTVPVGVTEITVEAWGGGGGGGGSSSNRDGGSGGGGGGYTKGTLSVGENQVINFTVGAGGSGASAGNNKGGDGGQSKFLTLVANGGTGGWGNRGTAGTGGSASGGTINITGANGSTGGNSGGNGGAGANGGAGGNGNTDGNGSAGQAPGGGGGGGEAFWFFGTTNYGGGAGAGGRITVTFIPKAIYSYRSGNWNDPATWTLDPGGTTHVGGIVPSANMIVVILAGRTVTLTENVAAGDLDVTILKDGILDMKGFSFAQQLKTLSGEGTLKLSSTTLPNSLSYGLMEAGGGTVEYNNTAAFVLPTGRTEYNNLTINLGGNYTATQSHDLSIHGNFNVKRGGYVINQNIQQRLKLTVGGDFVVDKGASVGLGIGTTTSDKLNGGTAPFLNYYDQNSHRIVLYGDFINNGTVKLLNVANARYGSFPRNGFATLYFMGASDAKMVCNGVTDVYNLVLDKGNDQTYKLTINSSDYKNFRLLGRNNLGGDGGDDKNPNLRKALWIRTGTLVLQGSLVIPSLTEGSDGGTPNSDFYIPVNGALVLDGPDVVVMTTADTDADVEAAYGSYPLGVNEAAYASSFSIYGRFQINDGYFSSRESGGFITWDKASGEFIVNGGFVDAKQFRAAGGANGLSSYVQTGGTVVLRGRFQRAAPASKTVKGLVEAGIDYTHKTNGLEDTKGTFNINNATNIFSMSGGSLQILDGGGRGYAIDIFSNPNNVNVTGGTIELLPVTQSHSNMTVRTSAPFGNLVVDRASGSTVVRLDNNSGFATGHLTVLNKVDLRRGELVTNNYNLTVGGDFAVESGFTYTHGSNTTSFNGSTRQILTINTPAAFSFNKVKIDKAAGQQVLLSGSQANMTIADSLFIYKGTLNDNGKTINVKGSIFNSGRHTGSGAIVMSGSSAQSIDGSGSGEFQNLELNNSSRDVALNAGVVINGKLKLVADRHLFIGQHNVRFNSEASIEGAGSNKYLKSAGNGGDGGVTFTYSVPGSKIFPVGVDYYTPATFEILPTPTSMGTITVAPVNYEHPVINNKGRSLNYFWRVKSSGFSGYNGLVNQWFTYHDKLVALPEEQYLPGIYNSNSQTWVRGGENDVDKTNNIIKPWSTSKNTIDGDYTAGRASSFITPAKFYSRDSGRWKDQTTWSQTGHNGGTATKIPGASDVVIIGNGHTVTLDRTDTNPNTDVQNSASLQIEKGGVLDASYNPSSNFGMVLSHPNGNGVFKVSHSRNGGIIEFPKGDFSDFNRNLGTTEFATPNVKSDFYLPDGIYEYGHLKVSPIGGGSIHMPNNNIKTYGDLILYAPTSQSFLVPTSSYRIPLVVNILGNLNIEGGALRFIGNGNFAQDFIVEGDIIVAAGGGIGTGDNADNQSISVGGSIINNAAGTPSGDNEFAGCDFFKIPVTFFSSMNSKITNASGNPSTTFGRVIVDKGTSQAATLTIDIGGTLSTPADNWLILKNGTLEYKRVNPSSDFTITTNSTFTIPATAGLLIDYDKNTGNKDVLIANANRDDNDLFLNGKLTVVNGNVFIGPKANPNNNNDIEYSGGGDSELDIRGGLLQVNGQIRRNPATTAGILKYRQSGGNLMIYGRKHQSANAKLEILNAGSEFSMSGGVITILRGGGGVTYGDLYVRPEKYSVTGGTVIFDQAGGIDGVADFGLDATAPLFNMQLVGNSSRRAKVVLLRSALTLKGNLDIGSNTTFDANSTYSVDLTVQGNYTNSGDYSHYMNTTIFSGGVQSVTDNSGDPTFYNLVVSPVTSLTINKNIEVKNNLKISSGTFITAANVVTVRGDIVNNSNYTDNGGGVLMKGSSKQNISGTGTFGKLELDNGLGCVALSDINLSKNLVMTNGLFTIGSNQLSLAAGSNITGGTFGINRMIVTDGVESSKGVSKVFAPGSGTFTYPLGVSGKYTPVLFSYTANGQNASLKINNVNSNHPAVLNPGQVLKYYWEVESNGFSGLTGTLQFTFQNADVQGVAANYWGARLMNNGSSWSKIQSAFDAGQRRITWNFTSESELSGDYTAGYDAAIPSNVPVFKSFKNGNWSDPTAWVQESGDPITLSGGPNGFIVKIDHVITADVNFCSSYRTYINATGTLRLPRPHYGHSFGLVSGSGTLYLEDGHMPEGTYDNFLGCGSNSTLIYGGNQDYTIIADLFNNAHNLIFTGTGSRVLPNKALTICNRMELNGPNVDNSVYNKTLYINGVIVRNSGTFTCGSGDEATVSLNGSSAQELGSFNGPSGLNNLEINNAAGLTLTGDVDVNGKLLLTKGVIKSSTTAMLSILNTDVDCVSPQGGSAASYVEGPLTKQMNQGGSFRFPLGVDGVLGNKLLLMATEPGTKLWTVEYHRPNATADQFDAIDPITGLGALTAVNRDEYWTAQTAGGGNARVQIWWDASSDINPLITANGISDIRVVRFSGGKWVEVKSSGTGNNNSGNSTTTQRVSISATGDSFTLGTVNTTKPKIKFTPQFVCGTTGGIPIELSTTVPTPAIYVISYSVNGVSQNDISISSFPYTLPTPVTGEYALSGFTYANGIGIGAVDSNPVSVYAIPTTASAGPDQSIKGGSSATLAGNVPVVGTGLWSVVTGNGGSFISPTLNNTDFNGVNGSSYQLRWTITNGQCTSEDDVNIVFPYSFYLWEGTISSDWATGNNWRGKLVPGDDSDVEINNSSAIYQPAISGIASMNDLVVSNGSLTVKPGAQVTVNGNISVAATTGALIIENNLNGLTGATGTDIEPASFIYNGAVVGDVTIRTNFPALARNWYLGMPANGNSHSYYDKTGNGKSFSLWTYNHANANEEWLTVSDNTALRNDMTAYVVNNGTGMVQTVDVSGNLPGASNTIALTKDSKYGFNLIANPYPAYMDPSKLDFYDMMPTIWYRTVNDQRYYKFSTHNTKENIVLPMGNDKLIAPMQGFWVRAWQNKNFSMDRTMLLHPQGNNPQLKSARVPDQDVLYIELANDKTSDQAAIAVRSSGSSSFGASDSEKRLATGVVPNIYSVKSGIYTAINIVSDEITDNSVDLGYSVGNGGNGSLTLRMLNITSFMPGTEVYLEDRLTGNVVNLRNNPEYAFEGSAGAVDNRFVLTFKRVSTGIGNEATDRSEGVIRIYGKEGKAVVTIAEDLMDNNAMVRIYSVGGALIGSHKVGETISEFALPDAKAVYIVEAEAGGKIKREKIIK